MNRSVVVWGNPFSVDAEGYREVIKGHSFKLKEPLQYDVDLFFLFWQASGTKWSLLHFRTPKEGYSVCICVIRSISTTMCDDLARATEAQDGKKKIFWQASGHRTSQNHVLSRTGLTTT